MVTLHLRGDEGTRIENNLSNVSMKSARLHAASFANKHNYLSYLLKTGYIANIRFCQICNLPVC